MNVLLGFVGMASLILVGTMVQAQSEPESSTLVIESQQSQRRVEVRVGERLNYQVKGEAMHRKDRLVSVQDSSVTIGAREVALADLEAVQLHDKRAPIGLGLVIGSLVAEPISLLLWVISLLAGLDNPTSGERVLMVFMGILTLFLIPAALIVGIVLLVLGNRRFRLGDKWRLRKG